MVEDTDTVQLMVNGQRVACERGKSLLNVVINAGLTIDTACGGSGRCHLCRVIVREGARSLPAPSALERRALGNALLARGARLACQIFAEEPLTLDIPTRRRRPSLRPALRGKK